MLNSFGWRYLCKVHVEAVRWLVQILTCVLVFVSISFAASIALSSQASAETRSLKLYYTHTRERAKIVFKKNGRYNQAGLKKLNHFLRDWRQNEPTNMDPRLFDLLWEAYRQSGAKNYIHVVSAYRSPATNEMLRKTRGGQAKRSQHMVGRAIDFYIPGVSIKKLRAIGMKLQGGGVGYYPKSASPFVHLDVGSVRAWPRMSRSELVRLFPNGKTLHLPSDGKPLPGYQIALAEYKRRKGTIKSPTPAAKSATKPVLVAEAEPKKQPTEQKDGERKGLFASLFSRNSGGDVKPETKTSEPQRVIVAALPTTAQNLASLPTTNIPVPVISSLTPVETPPLEPLEPEMPAVQDTGPDIEDTILAALPVPVPSNDLESESVQALAYQDSVGSGELPSFSAIMVAAIETDKQRKLNGEIPTPVVAGVLSKNEKPRIDIASLETPNLRPHNRLSRAELGQAIAKAAASGRGKAPRPNLRDAISVKHKAKPAEPDLQRINVSRRALSKDSISSMKPPVQAPQFVNRFMRKPPKVVYANGFSKSNVSQQKQKTFSGTAVNFLPIVKYNG